MEDKNYASDVRNLVLYALANSTETSAMIFTEDAERKPVLSSYVEPSTGESRNITKLLKSDQHYNVIVFGNTGNRLSIPIFKKDLDLDIYAELCCSNWKEDKK